MLIIKKRFIFEAAHRLPNHDGPCQRLHGHSWVMWVSVEPLSRDRGEGLNINGPKAGMLMDYGDMKAIVNPIVGKYLDHHYLNETVGGNPTSEYLCIWMGEKLLGADWPVGVGVSEVEIEETCTSSCRLILN